MTPTKFNLKKLERALDRAAKIAVLHGEALDFASKTFKETFGVDEVPEESFSIVGGNPQNEAGSLFNDMATHGENMVGNNATTEALVARMAELMAIGEEE